MDVFANSLGAVSALAVILEQVVEFLAKPLVPVKYRVVIPYAALVLGLGAAFAFSLDLSRHCWRLSMSPQPLIGLGNY